MKLYKQITISFLSAILAIMAVYGGYTIYAADDEGDNFRAQGLEFEEMLELYHDEMNDYFNTKISQLNILLEEEDFFELEAFKVPVEGVECTEENVSTFCVAEGALQIYLDYTLALDIVSDRLAIVQDDDDLEDILLRTAERNEKIVPEYDIARTAMDTTLAAFNEYRLAYPMHKQYKEVIEDLVKYKLQLKDLRWETDEFPQRFIDASSAQCP